MTELQQVSGVAVPGSLIPVSVSELVRLCALDTKLYCHTFFPKTFRQKSPPFHAEIHRLLESPQARFVGIEVFRGGAKTTLLRAFTSKRIAYGISRTIMFVSSSQEHAKRSVRWLRTQVEHNKLWRETFGLRKGGKWTDEFIEIIHDKLDYPIAIIAVGITGQTRGVNIEDYRPDLIVVDDADDEETTATPEQRAKGENRLFGAITKSLAPAAENEDAMLALLQTSLHKDDQINRCHKDPQFYTAKFGILDEAGKSRWPELYPIDMVLADKAAHIARGQTLLWLREMECKVGDEETADFKREWLKFWEVLPETMLVVIAIDPVPPPSELQVRQGFKNKDFEVIVCWGYYRGKYYLLEYARSRGHEPEWTITNFFRLIEKWQPLKARVEGIAYQRTLKWILEREMKNRRRYIQIDAEVKKKDKRKKRHRILQAFSGIGAAGNVYVHPSHQSFITEWSAYPNVDNEDVLDASSMAVDELLELGPELSDKEMDELEYSGSGTAEDLPEDWRAAP